MNKRYVGLAALLLVVSLAGCDHQAITDQDTSKTDRQSRHHKSTRNRPSKGTPAVECKKMGHNIAGKPVCLKWE